VESPYSEIRNFLFALPKSTDNEPGAKEVADKFFFGNLLDARGTIGALEESGQIMRSQTQNEPRGTARLYWWRIPTEADFRGDSC